MIRNLETCFYTDRGILKALDGVNFEMSKGETTGLVGETGCGKSVTALSIIRLVPKPGRITGGEVWFKEENLLKKSEEEMRLIRGDRISMIFQEPMTSLDPMFKIGDQMVEVISLHQKVDKKKALEIARQQLEAVNMPDPYETLGKYPHELSGGMRQRVMIAMALSCEPDLLIADEPTTAVDVTIQAQIMDLMESLKRRVKTSILLITHNLGLVAESCDRAAVMYAGNIVEYGDVSTIFERPAHPYTVGLMEAIPKLDEERKELKIIRGTVPSLIDPPTGCKFHPRCDYATDECRRRKPQPVEIEKRHVVSCIRAERI